MASTQTTTHSASMEPPDLAMWLVQVSADLHSASSRADLLRITRDAVQQIISAPVRFSSGQPGEPHDQTDDATLFPVAPELPGGQAYLHVDALSIDPQTHTAIRALLSILASRLTETSGNRTREPVASVDPNIQRVLALVDNAATKSDLFASIVSYCGEIFTCSGVAIVRNSSLMLEETWVRSRDHNIFDTRMLMRNLAGDLWADLAKSSAVVTSPASSVDSRPYAHAAAVRITRDGLDALALILYYPALDPDDRRQEADLLERLGKALRSSSEFQALLGPIEPEYTFADALNDVTLVAASTHELARLYEAVRDVLSKVIPMDAMLIAMIPPGEQAGVTVYRSERGTSYFERAPLSEAFQMGLRHGSPFIVDEIPSGLRSLGHRFGDPNTPARSLAGAPLVANDQVIGLIVVQSYLPAAFKTEHGDLLLHIGRSIAGALERAELIDRLRTQSIRENALRTVTERLTTSLNPYDLLDIAVSELAPALNSACIAAIRVTNSANPLKTAQVAVRGADALRTALGIDAELEVNPQGPLARALATETVQDLTGEHTSVLALPLHAETECIGAIAISREGTSAVSDQEYAMLATLSGTLSAALQMARLYEERSQHEQDLLEVQRISQLVASSLDAETILNEIITLLPRIFNAETCYVRVVDGDALVPLAIQTKPDESFAPRVPIATSLAGTIVTEKKVVAVYDLLTHPYTAEFARQTGVTTRGWVGAPLIDSDGSVIGVLSIRSSEPRIWTERDLVLLRTLSGTTTVAIQNAWRFARTRDVLMASIESLANAVDAKDPTTFNHSRNVSGYARKITEAMGYSQADVETTALAGLLHDIGKIGIPDRILQKAGALDADEWESMKTHPIIGEQILSGSPHLAPVLGLVRHHHERWDGTGYPDGLSGDDVPVGAAIVALADAVETMASNRPYSAALPWDAVCDIVRAESGRQFHPEVARHFLDLAERGLVVPPRVEVQPVIQAATPGTASLGHSLDPRAAMIFHGVAREVRALTDLETFITNITMVISGVMELSEVHIFLVDEHSGDIVYRPLAHDRLRGLSSTRAQSQGGVVGWVIQHAEPLLVPDVSLDNRFVPIPNSQTRSELAVPLIADGAVIGAINVESPRIAAFSDSDERLLSITADHLAQTIQVARLHDRFKQLASIDALTGLPNHRAFYERLDEEIRHALVTDGILTVAILDINQLKEVNDTYGHLAGDTILGEVATTLRERCRRSDFVARYGGDEFAFILADTDLEGANRAMAHIVNGLDSRSVLVNGNRLRLPSGAWGMAAFPDDGVRPAELVRVADLRMYNHKNISRTVPQNRTESTHGG